MSLKLEDFMGENINWSISCPSTTQGMINTGFHAWGFVIYRCVYGDDEAWERYVKYFEENVIDHLKDSGGDMLLSQHARWTVIQDRATLDGASVDAVREKFIAWRDEHKTDDLPISFEKRLVPMAKDPKPRLPRFTYCLYNDQLCLNTLAPFAEKFPRADRDFDESEYVAGGVRAGQGEQGQFPPIDGRTCRYVGWEYVDVRELGIIYNELHHRRLDDAMDYKRPPGIAPLTFEEMTDNGAVRAAWLIAKYGSRHSAMDGN